MEQIECLQLWEVKVRRERLKKAGSVCKALNAAKVYQPQDLNLCKQGQSSCDLGWFDRLGRPNVIVVRMVCAWSSEYDGSEVCRYIGTMREMYDGSR